MDHSPKTILIFANKPTTIVYFRLEVVAALVKAGYRVVVSVPAGNRMDEIRAVGAEIIETPFKKDGMNPVEDLRLLRTYRRLIRETGAQLVLTYTIKPNVYGGMAAASRNVPYVANITGLGTALDRPGALQKLAVLLYRMGFRKISRVFFQNEENRKFFEERKLALGKHVLLPGSGVNLTRFALLDYPPEEPTEFAFISRIRKEKGIEQYIDTVRAIRTEYPNTRFHVCGYGDEANEAWMRQLHEEGLIEFHGLLTDVRPMLERIHCILHPTYYPEGMSNALMESAASGRPIISTDRAGCREAIDHGVNGYLVREQDSADLIEKTRQFMALTYEEKKAMGLRGREKMEREFDRNIVVQQYLDTAAELIGPAE